MTATETEVQTITGICTGVVQKPGSDWVEFHIDGGGKYPVKLSTKLGALIDQGKGVGQELATWTYKEVDSGKPNPNRPGSNFINRYLEKVEVGGSVPEPEHPAPQKWAEAPSRPPVLGGDKDRLIVRQVCIKAAAEMYNANADGSPEDVPLAVMKAAQRFETWIYRDMDEVPFDEGGRPPLSDHDQSIPF